MHTLIKTVLFLLVTASVSTAQAQKKGAYFKETDPICRSWKYIVPPVADEAALTDEELALSEGAPFFEIMHELVMLMPGGGNESMVALFYDETMGYVCPSYFEASFDAKFIYFNFGETCIQDIPEQSKFLAVPYEYRAATNELLLQIDGVMYGFAPWEQQ